MGSHIVNDEGLLEVKLPFVILAVVVKSALLGVSLTRCKQPHRGSELLYLGICAGGGVPGLGKGRGLGWRWGKGEGCSRRWREQGARQRGRVDGEGSPSLCAMGQKPTCVAWSSARESRKRRRAGARGVCEKYLKIFKRESSRGWAWLQPGGECTGQRLKGNKDIVLT